MYFRALATVLFWLTTTAGVFGQTMCFCGTGPNDFQEIGCLPEDSCRAKCVHEYDKSYSFTRNDGRCVDAVGCNSFAAGPPGAAKNPSPFKIGPAEANYKPSKNSFCVSVPNPATITRSSCLVHDEHHGGQYCALGQNCNQVGFFVFTTFTKSGNSFCVRFENFHTENHRHVVLTLW